MIAEALRPALGTFRNRVVVVTGASSGIGRDTAILFGTLGAKVALVARRRHQPRRDGVPGRRGEGPPRLARSQCPVCAT